MPPRHFLDIDQFDAGTLRRILDMGHAMKKAGKHVPAKLKPAGPKLETARRRGF